MGYPWECSDCVWLDEKDQNWRGFRCTKKHIYVKPDERSCNNDFQNKKESNCYLTTAMCDILGQEDHGHILETLRNFRDTVMKNDPKYTPLLDEYNTIGPEISKNLYQDEQNKIIANSMLYLRIYQAIDNIKNKNYEEAINIYKDMTETLKEIYNVTSEPKAKIRHI